MPKSTSVSFTDEVEDPNGELREVELEASCTARRSANMNYGGLPDPPEGPTAEIEEAYYLDNGEDVGESLFERNVDKWIDEALERAADQDKRRQQGREYNPVEHGFRGRY